MPYISTSGPRRAPGQLESVPHSTTLRRKGQPAPALRVTLHRMSNVADREGKDDVWAAMRSLLNYEIVEAGNSYPFETALEPEQFSAYYASDEAFALVIDEIDGNDASSGWPQNGVTTPEGRTYDFGRRLVGCFYVKPNFPGRSGHICNGGFLVVPQFRNGFGVGKLLGSRFVVCARELGYHASFFNLVYNSNEGSVRLWDGLGFVRTGTVPNGARVKCQKTGKEIFVDAHQYFCDLRTPPKKVADAVGAKALSLKSKL